MLKAHKTFSVPTMRRASRVFLNDLNPGKIATLTDFLRTCHDVTQYFVDLFWQRQDFSSALADLATVHLGRDRFQITTRLAQALAKQAKEMVRAAQGKKKPQVRRHTVTLFSHFCTIEPFAGSFDHAIRLIGSGAPRMVIPCRSTRHLNRKITDGWIIGKSIRLGRNGPRLFVDFLLEKPRPAKRTAGEVMGLDSNYKNGFVASDGQMVGRDVYERIQTFSKRQKHTREEAKSLIFHALKSLDLSGVRLLVVEDLKNVRSGTRGKFPRILNRRMSHWVYKSCADWLSRRCEEQGIRLEGKNPWKTSQCCAICGKWDRRNRRGDRFICVLCGHSDHADLNAAKNLKTLGLAGVYGLRSLPSPKCYGLG